MSLKSFACVAALSAMASMSFAQLPTVSVDLVRNGDGNAVLDASGNWQYEVVVTPAVGGSTQTELNIEFTDADVLSAAIGDAIFDTANPSLSAPGWVSVDGDGIFTPAAQFDASQAPGTPNASVSVGSDTLTAATPYVLATFTTEGPSTTGSLSTTYAAGGTIFQNASSPTSGAITGGDTFTALAGDANLDGTVDGFDFSSLAGNFNNPGIWSTGDFTGDGTVDGFDFSVLAGGFNSSAPAPVSIPEPAALALAALGFAAIASKRS